MYALKTINVVIVAVAAVIAVAVVTLLGTAANDHADKRHTQMLQVCVNAGHIWVRGDCLIPTRSTP